MVAVLSASVMCADFKRLPEQFQKLDEGGIDRYHFDIMDGHLVPNFALSPLIMGSLRDLTQTPFEAHLMIEQPEHFLEATAQAGAQIIIVHAEATIHLRRVISQITKLGCRAGIAMNPTTPPDMLRYVLPDVSTVLLMTVDAGFAGQAFAPTVLEKIREVREMITDQRLSIEIEVDGGINPRTIPDCVRAGADVLVLGSTGLFNEPDLAESVRTTRHLADGARLLQA